MTATARPKILLLADKRNWAYDFAAQAMRAQLAGYYDFHIAYVAENPIAEVVAFQPDFIHVFWWGETWHQQLGLPRERIIKEVSSFRWREEAQFGHLSPQAFVERHLADAGHIVTTSRKMQDTLAPYRPILYTPNGIDPHIFYPETVPQGALQIGWSGNIKDACKGILDIIQPACAQDYPLHIASGTVGSRDEMRRFYNQLDIICIASTAEGQPLPLIEAMACGAFAVSVDVGIVPEVICHRHNGLIVDRSIAGFRAAFTWCDGNLDHLRQTRQERAALIHTTRSWESITPYWQTAYAQITQSMPIAGSHHS